MEHVLISNTNDILGHTENESLKAKTGKEFRGICQALKDYLLTKVRMGDSVYELSWLYKGQLLRTMAVARGTSYYYDPILSHLAIFEEKKISSEPQLMEDYGSENYKIFGKKTGKKITGYLFGVSIAEIAVHSLLRYKTDRSDRYKLLISSNNEVESSATYGISSNGQYFVSEDEKDSSSTVHYAIWISEGPIEGNIDLENDVFTVDVKPKYPHSLIKEIGEYRVSLD